MKVRRMGNALILLVRINWCNYFGKNWEYLGQKKVRISKKKKKKKTCLSVSPT